MLFSLCPFMGSYDGRWWREIRIWPRIAFCWCGYPLEFVYRLVYIVISCYGRRRVDIPCCSRNKVICDCVVRLVAVVANLMRAEEPRNLSGEPSHGEVLGVRNRTW